jgi:hypothetical protein
MKRIFEELLYSVLFIDSVRLRICKWRWIFLQKRLRFYHGSTTAGSIGQETVKHNLSAFEFDAVFGMARRMSLLLFPVAALLKDQLNTARVLIVGPRTEDDIFWAWSLGLRNTEGMDLFSYSKYIAVGDIHNSEIASDAYDAVLLGWMISYSSDPAKVIEECKRILKPGGYLGIGIEANPLQRVEGIKPPRVNNLNSSKDLIELVQSPVVFTNEPYQDIRYDCAIVFKILPR